MLLVFGPRSVDYDFGPGHPLTPRRFGPGIDLLRAVGAEPGLAAEPASDEELLSCHTRRYIEVVKRFASDPFGFPEAGIGEHGDTPPFADMHPASAAVAGGSLRAVEAIRRGEVEHAFHPGGGLHHAMADHASGFCVYNDVALAVARARRDGSRVLYLDVDVHHGDGVQAIHWFDPGVMTLSIHETGHALFPGTGDADEIGQGTAAGTSVNVPLPPGTGERGWLGAIRGLLPEVAAAFGPDLIVSQHGADSHAWDPLAHLNVTTTAMGEVARLVDAVAHRFAGGRWLATGGGGYDAYRVVPRAWALTWLAGAHREVPDATPIAWRERWAAEAARYGQAPLPERFVDPPNAGLADGVTDAADERSARIADVVRRVMVPRLIQAAVDRGWWDPLAPPLGMLSISPGHVGEAPTVVPDVDRATWSRLTLGRGVAGPAEPSEGHALLDTALTGGARITAAVAGSTVVGVAASVATEGAAGRELLALGVGPDHRRAGLAGRLLEAHLALPDIAGSEVTVELSVAERDPFDPLDRSLRASIMARILERAGFRIDPAAVASRSIDPLAIVGRRAAT